MRIDLIRKKKKFTPWDGATRACHGIYFLLNVHTIHADRCTMHTLLSRTLRQCVNPSKDNLRNGRAPCCKQMDPFENKAATYSGDFLIAPHTHPWPCQPLTTARTVEDNVLSKCSTNVDFELNRFSVQEVKICERNVV